MFSATPVESWRARTHWQDPDYFLHSAAAAPPVLGDVAVGAVNWNWDPGNALCHARHDASAACTESCAACHGHAAYQRPWRNVTLARFFRSLREGRKAIYYSPIEREFAAFAHDIDFTAALDTLEMQELASLRQKQPGLLGSPSPTASEPPLTYVWFGANGVTTQCHYDLSHNVHAVLSGQKTFILSDAKISAQLLLYPRSHPGSTKSQLSLELVNQIQETAARTHIEEMEGSTGAEATGLSDSARRIPGTKVELGAGDVLYLPPLMFHHVVSHNANRHTGIETDRIGGDGSGMNDRDNKSICFPVSANLWTYSAEYAVWEALLSLPLPDLFAGNGDEKGEKESATEPSATPVQIARGSEIGAVENEASEEHENNADRCGLKEVTDNLLRSVKVRGLLSWTLLVVELSNVTGLADNWLAAHRWVKAVLGEGRYKTSRDEYGLGGGGCSIPKEPQVLSSPQLDEELQRLARLHKLRQYSERVPQVLDAFAFPTDKRSPSLRLSAGARALLVANYLDEVRTSSS